MHKISVSDQFKLQHIATHCDWLILQDTQIGSAEGGRGDTRVRSQQALKDTQGQNGITHVRAHTHTHKYVVAHAHQCD